MSEPRRCNRCGINPVAYYGRGTCYQCVPKASPPARCGRCGVNPVAHRRRSTCYDCVPKASGPARCERCGVNLVAYPGRGTCYDCVPKTLTPQVCKRCGVNPIAYYGRATCYRCVPRARKNPLRCKKCGSETDYFTAGLCRRCHRKAPVIDSCRDCLAWGVTRRRDWLCEGCAAWRVRFPTPQECRSCRRMLSVNDKGHCRLCTRQAGLVRPRHDRADVAVANRFGQQLFLADLFRQKRLPAQPAHRLRPRPGRYPVAHEQLTLFHTDRDWAAGRRSGFGEPPLPDLAVYLDDILADHAAAHGWSKGTTVATRSAIRILLATQQTPGAVIKASEIAALKALSYYDRVPTVTTVLTLAGMFADDQQATIDVWFARRTAGLPEPMTAEISEWFHTMRHGRTEPPRYRPRKTATIEIRINSALHALHMWSAAGYQSLRQVGRQDVIDALPSEPNRHNQTLVALRALFRFLKARRIVFTNPTARLRGVPQRLNEPLPTNLDTVRAAINSNRPARAAVAALVAFYALRPIELKDIRLTDVHDGRLHLADRTILLAEPVRQRLASWLDERARRRPNTINPHLFINHYNALRTGPVGNGWFTETIGFSAQTIREDRILHEAIATAGDVRRLCDLFGISVGTAVRYIHTTDTPEPTVGSATEAPG